MNPIFNNLRSHVIAILSTVLFLSSNALLGGTVVSDTFDSGLGRWTTPSSSDGATLTLDSINERLDYISPATSSPYANISFNETLSDYTRPWKVTTMCHLGNITVGFQNWFAAVKMGADLGNSSYVTVALVERNDAGYERRYIETQLYNNGTKVAERIYPTNIESTALTIGFDPSSARILSYFYNGTSFVQSGAFELSIYGMSIAPLQQLHVGLGGASSSVVIAANQAYHSDFSFTFGDPWLSTKKPSLEMPAAGNLTLTGNAFERYRIQYSTSLASGSWALFRDVTLTDFSGTVTDSTSASRRFYRAFKPTYLADSNRDFSGIQGFGGWYYGYKLNVSSANYSTTSFTPMVYGPEFQAQFGLTENVWYVTASSHWSNIGRHFIHPNGTILPDPRTRAVNWAVRRWVSQVTGGALITINVSDANIRPELNDNGIVSRVYKDGVELSSTTVEPGGNIEETLFTYLAPGTVLDFAIDARDGNDQYDSTSQQIFVELLP